MKVTAQEALILLEWYRSAGVDEAIAEVPQDLLAEMPTAGFAPRPSISAPSDSAPRPAKRQLPERPPSLSAPAAAGAEVSVNIMAARELARSARTISELRSLLESFEGCGLKKTATRLCLCRGSAEARVMLIGEAPGKDEDARGLPFVGRAGRLLDRMLAAIELSEKDCYITNLVFWRPPGNRTPSPEEVQVCEPFVERQIELLRPEILVFLGNAAAKQLTGATEGIMKLRGKWLTYPSAPGLKAIATLHPAYLLRNPIAKRLAWRDLLAIRDVLDGRKPA
ncbi:MAG: uracil-DNA glycosylase [Rhodomicrobium sp.]